MKNKILIIGNGPSALKELRGYEIDNFEGKIVRFNHYQLTGYERHIGTRTDILVLGQLDVIEQLNEDYDYILLYQARLDGGEGLRKIRKLSSHNKVKFFPLDKKDRLKIILEMSKDIEPTTGLVAICWFFKNGNDIYIYGFDFSDSDYFASIKNDESHTLHDLNKENNYIDFLIENKFIKRF